MKMSEKIKMPISFVGNYSVSIIEGEEEKRERCQKLFIRALPVKERDESDGNRTRPTHRITYFDFGCRYLVDAVLVENEEDHVSFDAEGKIYRFSPGAKR